MKIKDAVYMLLEKASHPTVRYIDVTKTNVAIPSNGYYIDTSSWMPTTPTGYTFACAIIYDANYAGSYNTDHPIMSGDGRFLMGVRGKTYTSITVRYFFIK